MKRLWAWLAALSSAAEPERPGHADPLLAIAAPAWVAITLQRR
jgi:hypothetical protein